MTAFDQNVLFWLARYLYLFHYKSKDWRGSLWVGCCDLIVSFFPQWSSKLILMLQN